MKPSHGTWLGWTALLVAVVLIVVALTVPAQAQTTVECITITEDKAKAERAGLEYLGIRDVPWTENSQTVFYRNGPITVMSRVLNGCVEDATHPVGVYRAETGA